jgi:lysophospholipase L1-like esterase
VGPDFRIIENALNARTMMMEDPYFPHRLGIVSFEETLDANSPLDLVVIHLGVNELKHFFSLTSGMISLGLEKLVLASKTSFYGYPAPKTLVVAPAPVSPDIDKAIFGFIFGPSAYGKSLELGALYRDVASRNDCGFIDCADLGFSLSPSDGLHYTKEDHAKLGSAVAEKIREMLG